MSAMKSAFLVTVGFGASIIGLLVLALGAYVGYGVVMDLVQGAGPLGKDPLLSVLFVALGVVLLKGGIGLLRKGRASRLSRAGASTN